MSDELDLVRRARHLSETECAVAVYEGFKARKFQLSELHLDMLSLIFRRICPGEMHALLRPKNPSVQVSAHTSSAFSNAMLGYVKHAALSGHQLNGLMYMIATFIGRPSFLNEIPPDAANAIEKILEAWESAMMSKLGQSS